jgi:hypothetical protein
MESIKRSSGMNYSVNLTGIELELDVERNPRLHQLKGQSDKLCEVFAALKKGDINAFRRIDSKYLRRVNIYKCQTSRMYLNNAKMELRHRFSGFLKLESTAPGNLSFFKTHGSDPTLELLLTNCNNKGLFELEEGTGQVMQVCYSEDKVGRDLYPEHKLSWDEFVRFGKPYCLQVESKKNYLIKPSKKE